MRRSQPPKRKMPDRFFSSSDGEPPAPKKFCDNFNLLLGCSIQTSPLGNFSVLPVEMNEKILSCLPFSSIANLASVSRDWMTFIGNWLNLKRTSRYILADVKRFSLIISDKKDTNIRPCCSSLGSLIWVTTRFMDDGVARRLEWLRRLLRELHLNWRCSENTLRGFGAFLNSCFRFSDPKELDQVFQALFTRIKMKTYINTLLNYIPGIRRYHETRTRHIARTLFPEHRFLIAALGFLKREAESEWMSTSALARLVYVLYGPTYSDRNYINWEIVSNISPTYSMTPLGHFLNSPFWKKSPFCMKHILKALLGGEFTDWEPGAIGELFAVLDSDLSVPYLAQNSTNGAILVAVGKVSFEVMQNLLDKLRGVLIKEDFEELLANVESTASCQLAYTVDREMEITSSFIKPLKRIRTWVRGQIKEWLAPLKRRCSKRLSNRC